MNIIIPFSCDVGTFLPAGQHGLHRSEGRGDDTEPRGGAAGRRPHAGARGICTYVHSQAGQSVDGLHTVITFTNHILITEIKVTEASKGTERPSN